ncbi:hypothetical protein ElyMa_005174600 [Elysia marginata]|uniref:Uncharacterized protein n=1 Tax=Elysia marginata TaxID=1093978 RepID=A0AAV4JRT8_9GAST|nr:hypothetical protein ElyMa_005174600 [Elysia marginata]
MELTSIARMDTPPPCKYTENLENSVTCTPFLIHILFPHQTPLPSPRTPLHSLLSDQAYLRSQSGVKSGPSTRYYGWSSLQTCLTITGQPLLPVLERLLDLGKSTLAGPA